MATTKKKLSDKELSIHEAYEKALEKYGAALSRLRSGDFTQAQTEFEAIGSMEFDEPILLERTRMYSQICKNKLKAPPSAPVTQEELYLHAVIKSNSGQCDEAIRLLNTALQQAPSSAKALYARASAYAIKGNVEAAIGDLRQAIALEPPSRFQAVNDPDFEKIREEPAFIDIIEPTPAGA